MASLDEALTRLPSAAGREHETVELVRKSADGRHDAARPPARDVPRDDGGDGGKQVRSPRRGRRARQTGEQDARAE